FNESWLGHTGRTPTFLVQSAENGWAEDVHPEDVGRCLKIYDEAFDEHREFTMEYRLRQHDGQYRWIFNRCAPLFDSDGAGGTDGAKKMFVGDIGYFLDIHERKERERGGWGWGRRAFVPGKGLGGREEESKHATEK